MYTEPLNAGQIKHNFRLLKDKYNLLDPDCPNCRIITPIPANDFTYRPIPNNDLTYVQIPNPSPTPTPTPTPSSTPAPTNDIVSLQIPNGNLIYVEIPSTPTPTPTNTTTPTNTPTPTMTPTPSVTPRGIVPFSFDFDYMLCEYYFTDGTDMDTVTYMTVPSIMETTPSDPKPNIGPVNGKYYNYVGTCARSNSGPQFPYSGATPFLTYGGDNRSASGTESVLFNLIEFKIQNPSVTNIEFAFTSDWYGDVGINPVTMRATLWKGGTPIYLDDPDYTWINPTAIGVYYVNSSGQVITLNVQDCEPYELVSNLQYNINTYNGQFL
jgi:hypothetical protein